MEHSPRKHFEPVVKYEDMERIDSGKPETYTCSPFVNAVCSAFEVIGFSSDRAIGKYLGLDPDAVSTVLQVETGMQLTEIRQRLASFKLKRLKAEHPELSADEMAQLLGCNDRATLWKVINRTYKREKSVDWKSYVEKTAPKWNQYEHAAYVKRELS